MSKFQSTALTKPEWVHIIFVMALCQFKEMETNTQLTMSLTLSMGQLKTNLMLKHNMQLLVWLVDTHTLIPMTTTSNQELCSTKFLQSKTVRIVLQTFQAHLANADKILRTDSVLIFSRLILVTVVK